MRIFICVSIDAMCTVCHNALSTSSPCRTKAKELLDEKGVRYTGKNERDPVHYPSCAELENESHHTHLPLVQNASRAQAIELDKEGDGKQIRKVVADTTGKASLPAIWIRGQFIGDYNGLNSLNAKGELDGMLKYIPRTTHTSPR